MANKKTTAPAAEAPVTEQAAPAAEAPVQARAPLHPHEVRLTREDREEIAALAKAKAAAGLPYEMALESAETQVREDRCGLYVRVRNAFTPGQSGATTAKA